MELVFLLLRLAGDEMRAITRQREGGDFLWHRARGCLADCFVGAANTFCRLGEGLARGRAILLCVGNVQARLLPRLALPIEVHI